MDVRRYKILYFTLTPGHSRVEPGHVIPLLAPHWLVGDEEIADWLVCGKLGPDRWFAGRHTWSRVARESSVDSRPMASCIIIYELALCITLSRCFEPIQRSTGVRRKSACCCSLSPSSREPLSPALTPSPVIQCTHYTCTVCSNYTELPAIVMPHNEPHVGEVLASEWWSS